MRLDLDSATGSSAIFGEDRIVAPYTASAVAEPAEDHVKRPAKMNFVRLLLEFTRLSQESGEDNPAECYFAIDHVEFDPLTHDRVAEIATAMIADALRRLRCATAPEMVVILENVAGEVRFSIIDNSSRLPAPQECMQIQRAMIPLGGVHSTGRDAGLVNSAFCFLPRRRRSFGSELSTPSRQHAL